MLENIVFSRQLQSLHWAQMLGAENIIQAPYKVGVTELFNTT